MPTKPHPFGVDGPKTKAPNMRSNGCPYAPYSLSLCDDDDEWHGDGEMMCDDDGGGACVGVDGSSVGVCGVVVA
ncbi:hypothetical protein Tco_0025024 [Tanacetum coccineum]